MTLKLAVVGYGNLGKSLEKFILRDSELQLVAVYSRRRLDNKLYRPLEDIQRDGDFDIAMIALGSFNEVTQYARLFEKLDTVDSFDTHAKIADYKNWLNGTKRNNLSVVAVGWDPGLLSLARGVFGVGAKSVTTLWGEGVSQGHSNAIRCIDGVLDAVQFTLPKEDALEQIRQGERDGTKLHKRVCYVACVESDKVDAEKKIKTMPDYFADYETEVIFCSPQKVRELKKCTAHRGRVVACGEGFEAICDVKLDCNTDYTAQIMLAYAKILPALKADGYRGGVDVFDIPMRYLADRSLI